MPNLRKPVEIFSCTWNLLVCASHGSFATAVYKPMMSGTLQLTTLCWIPPTLIVTGSRNALVGIAARGSPDTGSVVASVTSSRKASDATFLSRWL